MTHGPEHHIEEAEHASHAAHHPFDRLVAMTIAIVAAFLACATMLSHRAHTATLQLQLEANDAGTKALEGFTKTFNTWSQYQSKRNRQDQHSSRLALIGVLAPSTVASGEEAKKEIDQWKSEVARYTKETKELADQAKKDQAEANADQRRADDLKHQSHHFHRLGDIYDLSELGIEMALVLCSVAVLTKRRSFWFSGIGIGLIGMAVLVYGIYQQYGVPFETGSHHHEPPGHSAPASPGKPEHSPAGH